MLAVLAVLALRGLAPPDTTPFPLVEGATWTYRGTITTGSRGSTVTRRVVHTMRIARVWPVGSLIAALVEGHPADLAWADPGGPRRVRVVVQTHRLELWTFPDTEIADFIPGIGLTRFHYHHHGTPMAVDVRLVARGHR